MALQDVNKPAREVLYLLYPWVVAGMGLRLWNASLRLVMFRDETTFAYQIRHVLQGTVLQDFSYYTFPPAFAFLAAPVAYINGDPEMAGRIISSVMGAATAIPAYYLARDLFGLRTAAVAAAAVALFPPLLGAPVMEEPTYAFFVTLGACLCYRAYLTGRARSYVLFGLSMAAAYLTRPEGFFVFFALAAYLLVMLWLAKSGLKKAAALVGCALFGFMLLAFPYMLQLRAHFGAWELSGKTRINLAKAAADEQMKEGDNPDEKSGEVYRELEMHKRGIGGNVLAELGAIAKRYPGNVKEEINSMVGIGGYPVVIAFLIGLFFVLVSPGRLKVLGLFFCVLTPLLMLPMVFIMDRIVLPYLPVTLVMASYGAARLAGAAGSLAKPDMRRFVLPTATAMCAAAMFIGRFGEILPETDMRKVLRENDGYYYYYNLRQAAELVRPVIKPGSRIVTRDNIFAYYAGGEYYLIPCTDIKGLMAFCRENRCDYLLYSLDEQEMRPQLMDALYKYGTPVNDPVGDGSLKLLVSTEDFLLYSINTKENG